VSKRKVALLAACDDPKLLAFAPWPRQRDLLAAAESGPRLQVWALGRRSGKTTMAALVCLHSCLFRADLDAMVRPGERRYAVVVANRDQARLLVRQARAIVERSPLVAELIAQATEDEISFANGTALRAFACSSRGGRGWPISTLVMDEAAHFLSETDGYQTAERVWEALVPSTAQFGDAARVIISSTPYGTENLFARLYRQATSGETRRRRRPPRRHWGGQPDDHGGVPGLRGEPRPRLLPGRVPGRVHRLGRRLPGPRSLRGRREGRAFALGRDRLGGGTGPRVFPGPVRGRGGRPPPHRARSAAPRQGGRLPRSRQLHRPGRSGRPGRRAVSRPGSDRPVRGGGGPGAAPRPRARRSPPQHVRRPRHPQEPPQADRPRRRGSPGARAPRLRRGSSPSQSLSARSWRPPSGRRSERLRRLRRP
jgi:hypothetical protein